MIEAKVTGIPELKAALRAIPDKLRKQALRNSLAAGARVVRDDARRNAPVLAASDPAVKQGRRKPGTLKKAIVVRTSKIARKAGDVGVFVNVRPAKGALIRGGKVVRAKQRGANSPNDPYYWRWVEFGRQARAAVAERLRVARNKKLGTKGVRRRRAMRAVGGLSGVRFLTRAAGSLGKALNVFIEKVKPEIARLNGQDKQP